MPAVDTEYDAVVAVVKQWPAARRFSLIHDVLRTLSDDRGDRNEQPAAAPRRSTLAHAIGLLKGDGPPPTDEQIGQLLEERRLEKFG